MVSIVETGIFLMEIDCQFPEVLEFLRLVSIRGLTYVEIIWIL